jgi:biotin operon repressor
VNPRKGDDLYSQAVLSRLGRGADAARSIASIQEQLGWTRRQVELALRALRMEGWPIGSGSRGVWIADAKELDATITSLHRRLVSQYLTLRKQRELRAQMRARLIEQTTLFGDAA